MAKTRLQDDRRARESGIRAMKSIFLPILFLSLLLPSPWLRAVEITADGSQVNVTPGNSWYESLQELFRQPPEFFARRAVRVVADKENSRYKVLHKPTPRLVTGPARPTNELLGEALGEAGFIRSADHPVYRDLTEGEVLG